MRNLLIFLELSLLLVLSGCSAMYTATSKNKLDVQTKMTHTIFLNPVAADKRTVFVQVKNTSDKPDFQLEPQIRAMVAAKGYRVVEDPEQAQFWLQAVILQAGRKNLRLQVPATGAMEGGAVGYALSAGNNGNHAGAVVLGALIGTLFDAGVKDIEYTVVADVQVQEKVNGEVSQTGTDTLQQGDGKVTQSFHKTTNRRTYQTRVVSTANKSNLKWEQAAAQIREGLARTIAGIL